MEFDGIACTATTSSWMHGPSSSASIFGHTSERRWAQTVQLTNSSRPTSMLF